jgi:hypothetical protein
MTRSRAVLPLAIAAAVVAVGLTVVLLDAKPRTAGSNYIAEVEEVAKVRGDGRRCQSDVLLPKDTAGVRLLIGSYGRPIPRLAVEATRGGRVLTRGSLAPGGDEGHVRVPLERVDRTTAGVRVCVTVEGSERSVLYGAAGRVRLEWERGGGETWLAIAPTVAHRIGLGKANAFGALLLPLALLLMVAGWAVAARLLLRELRA